MFDATTLTQQFAYLRESDVYDTIDKFASSDPSSEEIQGAISACQRGMEAVGDKFEEGDYFVSDLMYAAQIMGNSLDKLKPLMSSSDSKSIAGRIVLGSVAGDIHDIGKNIFRSLAEASGFEVIDIGIDKTPDIFVGAVTEHRPQIVGLSGVLTLSIESMKQTVQALIDAGVRDDVLVMIGGNAVSEEACVHIGADFWTKNAATGVKKGLAFVNA